MAHLFELKEKRQVPLKIHTKIVNAGLSLEEKEKFFRDFGPVSDSINIDALMNWDGADTFGRDFLLGQDQETAMNGVTTLKSTRKVCSAPFKGLAVNFDGQVSVCCVDWSYLTIVGDVNKENLRDIWNGKALRDFRLTQLEGRREELEACATCTHMQGFSRFEDLDGASEDLAEKIRQK